MSAHLSDALLALIRQRMPLYFCTTGKVKVVKTQPGPVCSVAVDNSEEIIEDVTWDFPGTPAVGSDCLVVFRDNVKSRPYATGFSQIEELDTVIGTQGPGVSLKAKAGSLKIELAAVSVQTDGSKVTVAAGPLTSCEGSSTGWKFSGKTEFGDEVHFKKKATSDVDFIAAGVSVVKHPHGFTGVPPSTHGATDPATATEGP